MDLQPFKVPVFPNINNAAQPPTAQQAGNGSDLIARFNGLIDALQPTVQSQWIVTLPPSTDNNKLRVYHLNVEEQTIVTYNVLSLYLPNLIRTYQAGVDFTPGSQLNISSVIRQGGVGYYFFVFEKADGTVKGTTYVTGNLNSVPPGSGRAFDAHKAVDAYVSELLSHRVSDSVPLVVSMVAGSVSFGLWDEAPG
ncbi:MAG: hypothetical protein KME17_08190 [Cyanosarcina radialis HA8281-LM2]|jgi:hypothetical protein|nr:hypothetical protein [Cyanosarcina radialis HA8281-LM2]